MRVLDKRETVSRRDFLAASSTTALGATLVFGAGTLVSTSQGWGMEVTALKPETMATLIQMARDIYPHDRVHDKYYAKAMKQHDEAAAGDEDTLKMLENGVADLNKRAGGDGYLGMGWEKDRVAILQDIDGDGFFQAIRGSLVVGLYNQKAVWPLFGYEGASAHKGGYIDRGFDDIDWV